MCYKDDYKDETKMNMNKKKITQEMSKVEVKGFEAKYYDFLMNLITFGTYSKFIKRAIRDLNIPKNSLVADFGSGTGKNDVFIFTFSDKSAKILGFDIGKEMIDKFRKNCNLPNFMLFETKIDENFKNKNFYNIPVYAFKKNEKRLFKIDLKEVFIANSGLKNKFKLNIKNKNSTKNNVIDNNGYFIAPENNIYLFKDIFNSNYEVDLNNKFDLVFISFVLHGFVQEKREIIIENAFNLLKKGGRFAILDYNEFNINKASFIPKYAITKIECPLATDFIKRDWKNILSKFKFKNFEEKFYYKKYVRLLITQK